MDHPFAEQAHHKNLLQLISLRNCAILSQLIVICGVHFGMHIPLPLPEMLTIVACMAVVNAATWQRSRRTTHVTASELFIHLLADVLFFSLQLHLSGGATNPFVSLFLLQVILAAIILEPFYAWLVFAVTFLCYFLLITFFHPLQYQIRFHLGELFDLHTHAMFFGYTLAGTLLVTYLTRIHANLRERDRRIEQLKQRALEQEHILRIGLLSAGAAHELSTPLTTLAVILNEWESYGIPQHETERSHEITTMKKEVARCKHIVSGILTASGHARAEAAEPIMIHPFLQQTLEAWRNRRQPETLLCDITGEDRRIAADTVIQQSIHNILDNAYEVSPHWLHFRAHTSPETLRICIEDHGGGFNEEALQRFGTPYTSTKEGHGRGLGLFLAYNTMRTLGGSAWAENTPDGARVCMEIPLANICLEADDHAN